MDIYISTGSPQLESRTAAIQQFVAFASQMSTQDETLLQARDDSTAVINQSSIYVFATSMMNIGNALASFGNARIGIDPEKLPVYLNDIDAEILAGEKPVLAF